MRLSGDDVFPVPRSLYNDIAELPQFGELNRLVRFAPPLPELLRDGRRRRLRLPRQTPVKPLVAVVGIDKVKRRALDRSGDVLDRPWS
jgi:hypothetical protein